MQAPQRFLCFLIYMLVVSSGCATAQKEDTAQQEDTAAGWLTAEPETAGFDTAVLSETVDFINQDTNGDFSSLVVTRNGRIVAEHYFNGHGPDSLRDMRSAGKSITSTLVGTAIADGLIPGVDTPVRPLFASYASIENDDEQKQAITIEHLLMMVSGLNANADDTDSPGYEDWMWESEDWVQFVLDLPMANPPGETWWYASANSFLVGAAVEEVTGKSLASYAEDRLFGPLGITSYRWLTTPKGRTVGQGNLFMRARDMAKIGQLYLNEGRWGNQEILPASWVHSSFEKRFAVPWNGYDHYGYGWYSHALEVGERTFNYHFASGNGGNKIYIFPDEQMVVVIQSAAYNTRYGQRRSDEVLRRVLSAVTM